MKLAGNLHFDLMLGLALRGLGAVSSFVLTWLIARMFGAEEVGVYQIGLATAALASIIATSGLDILLVREISARVHAGQMGAARQTFLTVLRVVFQHGIMVFAILILLAPAIASLTLDASPVTVFISIFAPVAILLPILKSANALLRTTGDVIYSQSLEGVFYTTLACAALGAVWASDMEVSSQFPAFVYVISMAIAAVIAVSMAIRRSRNWQGPGTSTIARWDGLPIAASPMAMDGSQWLILLAVTSSLGVAEAGIYRTAFQICLLFQLINASFAMMAGPHMARSVAAGEQEKLGRITRNAGLLGFVLCLPLAVVGLAAPSFLMGLFGPAFVSGASALQILICAQWVNVAFGPVGAALVTLHRERLVLKIELFASTTALLIALLLVRTYGMAGAAVGIFAGTAIRNLVNFLYLRRTILDALS